jgi:hypothetical protein
MDPDPSPDLAQDPTPDPTPFFIDFKDAKKNFIFFLTCPQAHHLHSKKLIFWIKFCVKILICRHYFSSLHTLMRKKKDTEPDSNLRLMDPGGPKTYGSCGSGSGSPTLLVSSKLSLFKDSITPHPKQSLHACQQKPYPYGEPVPLSRIRTWLIFSTRDTTILTK